MSIQLNILPFIGALLTMFITFSIMNGSAQEIVQFDGPLNEMATAFMSTLLSIVLLVFSFGPTKKVKE